MRQEHLPHIRKQNLFGSQEGDTGFEDKPVTLHDLARELNIRDFEPGIYRGTVDAISCDCCSRKLKYAFVVQVDGALVHCGVVCATKFLWGYSTMDLRAAARLDGRK